MNNWIQLTLVLLLRSLLLPVNASRLVQLFWADLRLRVLMTAHTVVVRPNREHHAKY
jgi:hypothetical protein